MQKRLNGSMQFWGIQSQKDLRFGQKSICFDFCAEIYKLGSAISSLRKFAISQA
jgi:hypothetical protein